MKRSLVLVAALLALALTLTSVAHGAEALQQTQTRLRAVLVAPNAPAVDVTVDGVVAFPGLSFPSVAKYINSSPGSHSVRVLRAGQQQAEPLLDTSANLAPNTDNTMVVVGLADALEPLVLQDDNSAPPPGQARLRLVHASPDAPPVDVAITGGPVLFSNVAYKGVGDYITRVAGTVNLEVREAGTSNVLLPLPNLPLNNCSVYTLFLTGLRGGNPPLQGVLSLDAITDCVPGTPAALRATAEAQPTGIVIIIFIFEGRVVVVVPGETPAAPTGTPTETNTPTQTPSPTPSATPTNTPTDTPTPISTSTPIPPPPTAVRPPTVSVPTVSVPTVAVPTVPMPTVPVARPTVAAPVATP